ncbi:MAG: UDP-N-acetylmuramoyl-L-alanine--D-glutamate ligase [Crocinitomicaceae bacterium]|nr:UDP-N-acetylmuramoyl-L-alanine--D-glutamate ligase [Crocinitomicaceae bacterium]
MPGEKIIILGGGESGTGAAILARKQGFDVFLSDKGELKETYIADLKKYDIPFETGKHSADLILASDQVIKSPGIPDKTELIQAIKNKGIPIISEIEFAGRYTNAKKICITGSNGKTTTTALTYHILKNAGLRVGIAGNIGQSFARLVAEQSFDYYVLELSSFQLDNMYDFKADVAVLTNITPDHLDRYEYQFSNYIRSKFRIVQNQTPADSFIYSADDPITIETLSSMNISSRLYPFSIREKHIREGSEGAYIHGEHFTIHINQNQFTMKITDLALQGKHNLRNSMAAGMVSCIFDLRKEIIRESLENFENLEHRLEFVSNVNGIMFINDSKATNVNSAWYALESFDKPIVWIAGGQDKGNDYSELLPLVKSKVKAIVCLTKDSSKIRKAFSGVVETIIDVTSADMAVLTSYDLGRQGDVVLLSPACASFDLFENYEDRGCQFKAAVRRL